MTEKEIQKHRDISSGITYDYQCSECGYTEDLYFHMNDERPKQYKCPECGNKTMTRIFGNKKIVIPFQWGDTDNDIKFDKSPSRRKHYF